MIFPSLESLLNRSAQGVRTWANIALAHWHRANKDKDIEHARQYKKYSEFVITLHNTKINNNAEYRNFRALQRNFEKVLTEYHEIFGVA